jgi:hypothetical protein
LHNAIADAGNLKHANLSLFFWNLDLAIGFGLVPAAYEFLPQGREKRFSPACLDVLKRLSIDARGAAISFGYAVGLSQGFLFGDVNEDPPEAVVFV